jgi:hypothetical protein
MELRSIASVIFLSTWNAFQCLFHLVQTFASKQGAPQGHLGPLRRRCYPLSLGVLLILSACGFVPALWPTSVYATQAMVSPLGVTNPSTAGLDDGPPAGKLFLVCCCATWCCRSGEVAWCGINYRVSLCYMGVHADLQCRCLGRRADRTPVSCIVVPRDTSAVHFYGFILSLTVWWWACTQILNLWHGVENRYQLLITCGVAFYRSWFDHC